MNTSYDFNKFLLTTRFIHFALILGLVMFCGVALFITGKQMSFMPDFGNPVIIVALLGCIITIGLSFVVPVIYRKVTPLPADIRAALQHYQAFCMVRWAVIEGGALFSGLVILLTKNVLPLGFFVISTSFLIYRYPSQKEFIAVTEKR